MVAFVLEKNKEHYFVFKYKSNHLHSKQSKIEQLSIFIKSNQIMIKSTKYFVVTNKK